MSDTYRYGAYGEYGETISTAAEESSSAAVYIGTLPVNLVRGYADLVNTPIKLTNLKAKSNVGYSDDWESFTLCEAIAAHFDNTKGNVGPIYAINVLDPDVHRKAEQSSENITFVGTKAQLASDTIILDTVAIADMVEGTDYTLSYSMENNVLTVTSLSESLTGTVAVNFYEIDATVVTTSDIIGEATDEGIYTGMHVAELMQPRLNVVPAILVAPGYSEDPAVYKAMVAFSQEINGHWDAFVLADMPISDSGTAVDTIAKAIAWKNENSYDSGYSKVYWPKAVTSGGTVYHLSTMACVEMMRTDASHNGVPMETNGNKTIPVADFYFGESSTNRGYDQQTANALCQNGISTLSAYGGNWVLWGDHTAAYAYGGTYDGKYRFDTNIRMLMYLINRFQKVWAAYIDEPMTVAMRDTIINSEQANLDALVAEGAILGTPFIVFDTSDEAQADMVEGYFYFDISETNTPPLKAAVVTVAYSEDGISTLADEGSDE